MAYVVPQALIYQEFSILPTALTDPLRACIIGPNYALNRYSDSDEKPLIKVTDHYDPDTDTAYLWPNRPAGSSVDEDYTKVYIDDALLEYYEDTTGDATVVSGYRNRVRFPTFVLQTKNGSTRSGIFCDRDVAIGDVLKFIGSSCGEAQEFESQVLGFVADPIPAVIQPAESDTVNKSSQTLAESSSQTAGSANNVCISAVDASAFDDREDGVISDTYTVKVLVTGTGGDAETAVLQVTSATGTDDDDSLIPAAFGSATSIGARGLEVIFENDGCGSSSSPGGSIDPDDFIAGQTWVFTVRQAFDAPVAASGGVYLGTSDTTYVVEVVEGGDFGDARIQTSTTTGVDQSAPAVVAALATPVSIGSQGLTITFSSAATGLCKGDRYLIEVEAEQDGAIRTVILDTPVPLELRGICNDGTSSSSSEVPPSMNTTFYIKKDIQVSQNRTGFAPLTNWEQSATQITMQSGVVAYDATYTCSGVLTALLVKDGKVYVEHRDLVTTFCGEVGSVSTVSEIAAAFDDAAVIDSDNPLVFGVYKALQNAAGTPVKFIGVCASSPIELEDWAAALEILEGRDDVYSLTPMTQDQTTLQLVQAHIEAMSSPEKGRWRIGWFNLEADTEAAEYTCSEALSAGTCDPVLATIIDDPDTSGSQYTLVSAEGQHFLTSEDQEVVAGDILRAQYQDNGFGTTTYTEYVIDAVLNEEELRLVSGPSSPITVPSKIEIWRNLSRTGVATEFATNAGTFNSRRVYLVWPDEVGNAGETFEGYYLCAALAGLRSASLPHRPLTNVEILGFDDISRTTEFFNEPQLDILAAAGIWIVTQDPNDGDVYTRHQLSTDNLDLNRSEQSVTTNVDSISYAFLNRLAVYIGRGNVTPIMINIIRGEILALLDYFAAFVVTDIVGPQVLSYEIVQLEQHSVLKDRILAKVSLEVPYPLNNVELHLVI